MKSTIRRIIREEIDDFDWVKNTSHVSAEEGNNFILIADVIEDLPCKPQEMMFKAGYRWAGDIPSVHGNPLECKDKGIHNKPYVLIPQQGAVNYYNGYRKFGMVGWMNREGGTKFMRDYIEKWNPTIILWSDVVNKEPDFVLDMDNSINEQDDFEWIRNEEVYYPINNINELKIGQKYYIDYRVGYDNEQLNLPVVFRSYPTRGASSYQFVGEGKDGKLRNYLFFRYSTGEGLQDMIDKGKVKYKKSELKEQDDFEWVREMEPYNIHQGPWIIIYDGDEEFVEVQEWLFTQGYEWVNVEQPTTVMMPQYPNDSAGFLFSGWVDPDYPHSNELFDGYGGKRGMDMLDRIKASGDRVIYKWSKDIKPYIGV
jgi:hypothetical protein